MSNDKITPIGLLRTCFGSEHFPALFSGKETHTPALRLTGQIVKFTQDEEWITEIIKSGLPSDYNSNTLKEIKSMVSWNIENGFHEEPEKEKKSPPQLLIELVEAKGCELFHDTLGRPFILYIENEHLQVFPLASTAARRLLTRLFYKEYGRTLGQQQFKQACDLLEAMALFDGPERKVYLRVAPHDGQIIINLANKNGEVVIIGKNGYEITDKSPVMFVASPAMDEILKPEKGQESILRDFQLLLGLNDMAFTRVMAFLINCLNSDGPYLCLLVQGEQGSGKSFLTECCKALVDPSQAPKIRLPNNERDLMIQAKDNMVMLFDNVSGLTADISDALCSLSTGGGFLTRKLYTDDELMVFTQKRPFILNGIASYATRPDLLERSVSIQMHPMAENQRKGEENMRKEFERMRPALFAKLCEIVSCALRNFDETVTPTTVRMADAARWLVAAEPETGLPKGSLLNALQESQQEIILESLSQNSLAVALSQVARVKRFRGKVSELFTVLEQHRPSRYDRSFPSTPAHLSRALGMLRKPLEAAGIIVKHGHKARDGKYIEVYLADQHEEILSAIPQQHRTPTPEGGIEV